MSFEVEDKRKGFLWLAEKNEMLSISQEAVAKPWRDCY